MSALSIPDIAFQKLLNASKGSLTAEATMMKGQFGKRGCVTFVWNALEFEKRLIRTLAEMCHVCLECFRIC